MTCVLYGITEDEPALSGKAGLDGARLEAVRHRQLVAIVSAGRETDQAADLDRLLEYQRVIQSLMERRSVLPARFGSRSSGRAELCELLERRYHQLLASLERVRGAVELALRAEWRDPSPASSGGRPGDGTAYLLARVDLHRRATAVARRLDPLATHARACQTRVLPRPELAVSSAYLIEPARLGEFAETLAEIDGPAEPIDLVCTGPWPPYSFVGGLPE
jgi:Gas vesicle synthesis protein GvpL/GvpF